MLFRITDKISLGGRNKGKNKTVFIVMKFDLG